MHVLGFTCVYCPPLGAGPDDTTAQINTFHWHVVDSQSFPLVIPGFADIAEKSAYSVSAVYTPEDVADIVAYAGAVRPPQSHADSVRKLNLSPSKTYYSVESTFSSYVAFPIMGIRYGMQNR